MIALWLVANYRGLLKGTEDLHKDISHLQKQYADYCKYKEKCDEKEEIELLEFKCIDVEENTVEIVPFGMTESSAFYKEQKEHLQLQLLQTKLELEVLEEKVAALQLGSKKLVGAVEIMTSLQANAEKAEQAKKQEELQKKQLQSTANVESLFQSGPNQPIAKFDQSAQKAQEYVEQKKKLNEKETTEQTLPKKPLPEVIPIEEDTEDEDDDEDEDDAVSDDASYKSEK